MGEKRNILAFAERLKRTHQAVRKWNMTDQECLDMAQYFTVNLANPWRDDIYVWRDKATQKMIYSDSYKILARWAREACKYDEKFEALTPKDGERHRVRCWIMREDKLENMQLYVDMGVPVMEAYKMAATYADAVVREDETTGYKKPPTGWTWEQRCRIRALKNALRLSHGAPSPKELMEQAMTVNGVLTKPEDWEHGEEISGYEAERLAELNARERARAERWEALSEEEQQAKFEENVNMMRGPADFEGFGDEVSTSNGAPVEVNGGTENGRLPGEDEQDELEAEFARKLEQEGQAPLPMGGVS
jgi:hypothetical protein